MRRDGDGGEMVKPGVAAIRREHVGCADLVLAGGGVKGIAHVGAIQALEEHGYDRIQRVVGTSVGALVGALVAAGVPGAEIEGHIMRFRFSDLRDRAGIDRLPLLGQTFSILGELGVYEGKRVRRWLNDVLRDLGAETFGELKARAAKRPGYAVDARCSPLVVLTADVTRGRLVALPDDYAEYGCDPDGQRVADAVRASLSIPIFFEPVRLGESILVDGGILANYPIRTFDRDDPAEARWPTLGMTLLGPEEGRRLGRDAITTVFPALRLAPRRLRDYLAALTGTLVVGQDQYALARDGVRQRTIEIDANAYGVVDFGIDDDGKRALIRQGREAATAFMRGWTGRDGRRGSGTFPLPARAAAGGRVGGGEGQER